MALQHKRSSVTNKRPDPIGLSDGQLALNLNAASTGLFYRNASNELVKVGPVHVGSGAPNASPATGGATGNTVGEQWLDTTGGNYVLKVYDGTAWRAVEIEPGSARQLLQTNAAGTDVEFTSDIDVPGTLDVTGAATFDSSVTVAGDLTVNGTTTTIDTTTLVVEDKNIEMGVVTTPTDSTADGGGITLKGATDKTINWVQSTGCWTFNQPTNFNDHVRIDSSGNVGIGTTSADSKLHVYDGASGGTPSTNAKITIEDNNNAYLNLLVPSAYNCGVYFGDNDDADIGYINYSHGSNHLAFGVNAGERARIDSSGRLGIGTSSPDALLHLKATSPFIRFTDSADDSHYAHIGYSDSSVWLIDADAGNAKANSAIQFKVDNTERMRITSGGYLKAANDGSYFNTTGNYHELGNTNNVPALILRARNASQTDTAFSISPVRAASSAYKMIMCYSGNETDLEFNLRGDGNAYADGSWNGGGADYAEYFEWSDSNANNEDRRGISVVLDGDKIREAQAGDDPIGVISGNPSVVGDAAWNKWNGKHLRDEFGSYVLDNNGERQLNPAFDPDVEYISREERPEWDCVGLMGKLRIRKGQVTGSRWIKMRDISDSVEEWLVR